MDREELLVLYNDELPKWERYIYSYAYRLITKYKNIIDGSMDVEDICQELRISLWRAVQKYEEIKGSSLSSYIYLLLKRDAVSIIQQQFRAHPKVSAERFYQVIPFSGLEKDDTIDLLSYVKDPDAILDQTIIDRVWFEKEIGLIDQIMQPRRTTHKDKRAGTSETIEWHERDILKMLLSGKYKSDSEISRELKINFAKVGEIRAIIRAALCILNGWDITELSEDLNLDLLIPRTYYKLRKCVGTTELYPVYKVLPPDKWRALLIRKSASLPPDRGRELLISKSIHLEDQG